MAKIRIHDFTFYARPNADGFSLGEIPGIGMYPDRSALLPGICYLDGALHADVAVDHLQTYLRPLGLGAQELRFTQGLSLFEGILNCELSCNELMHDLLCDDTATLEAFSASEEFDRFVGSLNIDPHRLRTPPTSVMRTLDDKEAIRRLAHTLALDDVFPEHVFTMDVHETIARIEEFRKKFPELVVVKRPDLESGVGQLLIYTETSEEEIFAYAHQYCTGHRPIIIEQGVFGVEGSVQWYVGPKGIERRFFSQQYTHGGTHQGNAIASCDVDCLPDAWSLEWREHMVDRIWSSTERFVKWVAARGFVGPIGFDFIANPSAFYLLECNARTTAGTYLESVRWQIAQQGFHEVSAAMKNAYPKHARNWQDAVRVLSELPVPMSYDPKDATGVIIANPRLFHLDTPKCLLISIGKTKAQAEALLDHARRVL